MTQRGRTQLRRVKWSVGLVALGALFIWDITHTAAVRNDQKIDPILIDPLMESAPMTNPVVGICRSNDPDMGALAAPVTVDLNSAQVDSLTRLAVQRGGGFADVVLPGDWVVVKPNILTVPGIEGMTWNHEGTVTDLRVVKSVIEQLLEEGDATRITVAEGKVWRKLGEPETPLDQTFDGWTYHWPWYGSLSYEDMLADLDASAPGVTIDYIDLDYPPYTSGVPVPGGGLSANFYTVPDAILNCDKLIGVAVMKTHSLAKITLTNKLYIGTSPASVYRTGYWDHFGVDHNQLHQTIVDLMSFHPPDFGIVECVIGTQGSGPLGGSAIQRNLVLASKDPVAVDAAAAYTMGFNPWDVDHLHYAHNKGFGIYNLDHIDINGPSLDDAQYNFAKATSQGRGNRVWLVNGTHTGTDINYDYLGGQETTVSPIEGEITGGQSWATLVAATDYMDLSAYFGVPSGCIAYAFTRVIADSAMTVRLRFGSDDGIKIWLNGSVIYTNGSTGGWSAVETDVPISLLPGANRILIKVKNTTGAYGFSTYVCESDGDTPTGIEYSTLPGAAPMITLNAPPDGHSANDTPVVLSASVTDPDLDAMTVTVYCDKVDASDPVYVQSGVPSGSTIGYSFARPVLQPDVSTVGLWHFDEGSGGVLYDASGNGQDGYWHCDSTVDEMWDTDGPFGHAAHFSGFRTPTTDNPCAADYVEVPDNAGLDVDPAGEITMEFWVNPDYLPAPGERFWGLVNKRVPCTGPDTNLCSGNPANYCIFWNHPTQTIGFYGNTQLNVSTCGLTVGEWQYIAVTVDGPTQDIRFYRNGEFIDQQTGPIGDLVEGPLRIGSSAYRMKGVDGVMDEVRISRRVLPASEIEANYRAATGTYYWRVEASDGTTTSGSATRQFTIDLGADTTPPVVTLVSPGNGATTSGTFMNLSATVDDQDPTTARVYGGTDANPTNLLYVVDNPPGLNAVDYTWNMFPLTPEAIHTLGLWHFDEGAGGAAADATTYGNSGSIVGNVGWATGGQFGYALDLDGATGYVVVSDDPSLDISATTGEITIEVWVYPHSSAGGVYRSILAKRAFPGTSTNYQISLDNTTGNLLWYNGSSIDVSSVSVPLNQWSYLAVTLNAAEGRARFYRNGALLDSLDGRSFGAANSEPLYIGVSSQVSECFDGLIDEVRVSDRMLTPAEIAANYGLAADTYFWKVTATDGANPTTESSVRNFTVLPPGGDTDPPVVALLSPAAGATIGVDHADLSASATDASPPMTIWIYGDDQPDPTSLLYVEQGVADMSTINYDWSASVLQPESPYTMGLWHLDEGTGTTAADASTNGNSAAFSSAPGWTAGQFGHALDFDGVDDYIEIPDASSLDVDSVSGTLTMEAWINPDVAGGDAVWRTIVAKKGMSGVGVNYQMSLDRTTGNLTFYSGRFPEIWISSVGIPVGQWSYVAITLDALEGKLRFYRNGVALDSTAAAAAWFGPAHNDALHIGVSGSTSESFDGKIDEVRLTNRVLSSAEIAANYRLNDGTYYWKVAAADALGNADTTGPRSFVISLGAAPDIPTLIAPADLATIGDNTPTFQWSATAGPGGSYTLQYALDAGFTLGVVTVPGLTGTTHTVPLALADDTYHWHVQAINSGSTPSGYQASPFSFTVSTSTDTAPPLITLNSPADGAVTANPFMALSTTLSDLSPPLTVSIHGDGPLGPNSLLYVEEGVADLATINYDWSAPVLQPEAPYTMGLYHLDLYAGTSVSDASVNGNGGNFSGAPLWTTAGRYGYALQFDGIDDYVVIPDDPTLDIDSTTGALTIEAWVYPHSSGGGQYGTIVAKRGFGTGGGPCNYQFSLNGSDGNLLFYAGHWPQVWVSSVYVPENVWSYVAVTLSAVEGRLRFYLNGVQADSIDAAVFGGINAHPLYIGVANVTSECFDGVMDEIRLTDRVLSSDEIAANYLLEDGVYLWEVTASDVFNNTGTAGPRSFTISTGGTLPPAVPALILPEDEVITNDHTPTFVWQATAGSGGTYTLQYTTDSTFTTGVVAVPDIVDTSYAVPPTFPGGVGLLDNIYHWRVQAFNSGGDSSGYQMNPFSLNVDTDPPAVPVLIDPADEAIISDNTPEFMWSHTAGAGGTYTLEYAIDSQFVTRVTVTNLTDTTYQVPVPLADQEYYWHVQAVDAASNVSGYQASPYAFLVQNAPPVVPVLLTPPDSSFTCDSTPTFTWASSNPVPLDQRTNTVSESSASGAAFAATYTLQYGFDATFAQTTTIAGLVATEYTVPDSVALADTTYYWRVEAVDAANNHGGYQEHPFMLSLFVVGDQTMDGSVTASDIIHLVNYTFKGGLEPQPCAAAGDVNCDGSVTASDIIYMVNYVFKGGTSPCDLGALIANGTWNCP